MLPNPITKRGWGTGPVYYGAGRWVATCFYCKEIITRDAKTRKVAKDILAGHDRTIHGMPGLGRVCLKTWHRLPSTPD